MNRGRRFESIFSDEHDYLLFIDLLIEISEMWNARIAAFCLMPNHYHLLVQTPDGNISRCMRHLNSVYTQRYNRRHQYDGSLFRGRYKSILVSDDSYLLQLVRYIHRNPLRAGIVSNMQKYPWSSYNGYLSYAKKWDWLQKDAIFNMITPKKRDRRKAFIAFMQQEDTPEVTRLFSKKNLPSLFGPENFIAQIRERYYLRKNSYEVPESRRLAPNPDAIIRAVCDYYSVGFDDLLISRRGYLNTPRNVAIYLLRHLRGDDLNSIKDAFQIKTYSTVSSVVQKTAHLKAKNRKIRKDIQLIKNRIFELSTS
jgi:REP element-mobilizing transposase RayT